MAYRKYYVYKEKVSYDNGQTWTYTSNESTSGDPIGMYETIEECSSAVTPTIEYRWVNLDLSVDYYCSGTTKMYKQKQQMSVNGGLSWTDVEPAVYQMGESAQTGSTDCGYAPTPIYEWRKAPAYEEYECVGRDKHYVEYYSVSYDNGNSWYYTTPLSSRTSSDVIEYNSDDCGS